MAGRLLVEYENGPFRALFNIHGRDLGGTVRLFRANILKVGTNDLVDGFDPDVVAHDGSAQTLKQYRRQCRSQLRAGRLGSTIYSVTAIERARAKGSSDIDGGYGSLAAPPYDPGVIPFSSETGSYNRPKEITQ